MPDYPAYNRFVKDVPEYVQKAIEQSRIYEVAYTDALDAAQKALDEYHTGRWGDATRDPYPVFIEHAVSELDPFKIQPIIMSAHTNLYKAALQYWARQGSYNVSDVWEWFDAVIKEYGHIQNIPHARNIWDEFTNKFPITLPRDEAGKVDATQLDQMTNLQRAWITAQSAEIAETCALGGGDDTWFDYLPAGIETLSKLQSEDWAKVWAEYINTVVSIEDEDERFDAEQTFSEQHDLYVMDVTTPLLSIFL